MRNQVTAALKRRKKETASGITVAAIGVAAVLTLGAGTAAAHGMVTSGEIQNQTISQADVGFGGVSGSNGQGNSEIEGQSVGSWNIGEEQVKSFQIKNGSVHEKDLSDDVKTKLNTDKTGSTVTTDSTSNLDGTVTLDADTPKTVATLDNVSAGALVVSHVTGSGNEKTSNNFVCSLKQTRDSAFAEANEKLSTAGQQNGSMTLVGVAPQDGTVALVCHAGNGGIVTDVTLAAVNIS